MPAFTESSASSSSTMAEQNLLRKSRNHFNHEHPIPTGTDPDPNISRSSKSTISSLFISPFSTNAGESTTTTSKKKGSTFRGLGCTASSAQQVSVPGVIRSSAEWEGKTVKKKKNLQQQKRKTNENVNKGSHYQPGLGVGSSSNSNSNNDGNSNGSFNHGSCMAGQDVWCGPGIGLSTDTVVGSVDCVVARRNLNGRGKLDGDKLIQRERGKERDREREVHTVFELEKDKLFSCSRSCLPRRVAMNPDTVALLDVDPLFVPFQPEPEVFGTRKYHHYRHPSPDGLAEILMLQNGFMMGGRLDRFSDWRLDIDNMSYEELLELGDKIGHVCTGLKEDEISHCIRKIRFSILNDLSTHFPTIVDRNCSVCQEDYEADDELGKLECGHGFHVQCIKQWLAHKNTCPVCKDAPVARG
ncbi:hypothetical protein K2173_028284 [Erythroxylum novogranatense]|uniref:RING-type E3 ubiquitin transferase n=1 Tax=Erythroxylum novogranatense TaxID=1862640 RepID=A0AAV8U1D0_9ROSI|nr:hypothetical protein K2173_028284 [Erythroxylum novogranatense]